MVDGKHGGLNDLLKGHNMITQDMLGAGEMSDESQGAHSPLNGKTPREGDAAN